MRNWLRRNWKWIAGSLVGLGSLVVLVVLFFFWPGWVWNWNPRVIEKKVEITRVVEKPVEKVVKETVIKEVTKVVEKEVPKVETVIVEKPVVVTVEKPVVVTVVAEKRVEVLVMPTPESKTIASAATHDNSGKAPVLFDGQSTGKEFRASYDIGVKPGQVGIVFGYALAWNNQTSGGKGCGLVWLEPGWYEKLAITDGRYEIYDLPEDDQEGWIKALVEQRATEQARNYACPTKEFGKVPIWSSSTPSPPSATITPTATATPEPTPERRPSGVGKEANFKKGESVVGFKITLESGKIYQDCYFEEAPEDGTVLDGVVNYWPGEIKDKKVCK